MGFRSKDVADLLHVPSEVKALHALLLEHLKTLEVQVETAADVTKILGLEIELPKSAVVELRGRVLQDPTLAGTAGEALRHFSASALKKGASDMNARLLRVQLLMLAAPEAIRTKLLAAIRKDLNRFSDNIKQTIQSHPNLFIPQVTIGGGPLGVMVANCAQEFGVAGANLVVDASSAGDGNFGSVRDHLLNGKTRQGYQGADLVAMKSPLRSRNPLFGSPLQVDHLNPTQTWPTAAEMGDASSIGLYTASQRGTPVIVNTRVTNIEETPGGRGRYLVSMEDAAGQHLKIYTNQVVIATGLGVPKVPLTDTASKAYIEEQAERIRAKGPAALHDQAVMHSEDMLRATKSASNRQILNIVTGEPGNLTVVGFGDSAKTPLLRIEKAAKEEGFTMQELFGHRKIDWIAGPSYKKEDLDSAFKLNGPYFSLRQYFDTGLVNPIAARLEGIRPGRSHTQSRITLKTADGNTVVRESGRVILAMGMEQQCGKFLGSLAPDGYQPSKHRVPVPGDDGVFKDGVLGMRLHVGGNDHDVFFCGVAAGVTLPSRPMTSFIEYGGWKSRALAQQHLVPGIKRRDVRPFDTDAQAELLQPNKALKLDPVIRPPKRGGSSAT